MYKIGYCSVECCEAAIYSPSADGGNLTHLLSEDSAYLESQPGVSLKSLMNTPKCTLFLTIR